MTSSVGFLCMTSMLLACAPVTASPPPTPDGLHTTQPAPASISIIIGFRSPQAFDSVALLRTLEQHSGARVQYQNAAGELAHSYRFTPAAGQSTAQLLTLLRNIPIVAYAEPNSKVKPH